MAIFKRKTVKLVDQLDTKAGALRIRQDRQLSAADNFTALRYEAEAAALLADKQATAVEKASAILAEAGVTL